MDYVTLNLSYKGKDLSRKYLSTILFLFFLLTVTAQTDTSTSKPSKQIDPSKPSNLYTQVNGNLEFQSSSSNNLYGLRVNVQYAFNPNNLFFLELPLLNNSKGSTSGLGDIRFRYFNVAKRNLSPKVIALAPFVDIGIPTGSYEKGLGSSSWSLAGGLVMGYVVSKQLALFPGISYVHVTKAQSKIIPDALKTNRNGIGLQFNASYSFNSSTFLFINPTPSFLNSNGNWTTTWAGELNFNKIVKPNKLLFNAYWGPNFTNKIHVYRFGATVFL
jgi:hypothetical protein